MPATTKQFVYKAETKPGHASLITLSIDDDLNI